MSTASIGGGQAGYNWQQGNWLVGLEADIQGSDERGSSDVCVVAGCALGTGILTANYKLDWFGTVRGRVGLLPTDRVLIYATGGLAYGELSATAPLVPLSWGSTRAGWTVGAGAEVKLDNNWSVKIEYLYMDLGDVGSGSITATNVVTPPGAPVTLQHGHYHDPHLRLQYPLHRQYPARRRQLSVRWPGIREVLISPWRLETKSPGVVRGFFLAGEPKAGRNHHGAGDLPMYCRTPGAPTGVRRTTASARPPRAGAGSF